MAFRREERNYDLYLAWAGNAGNIWLVSAKTGEILETLWESKTNPPGAVFRLPPSPRLIDWRRLTLPEFVSQRAPKADVPLSEWLAQSVWGIDQALAAHIAHVVGDSSTPPGTSRQWWMQFSTILRELRDAVRIDSPVIVQEETSAERVILPSVESRDGTKFDSLSDALAFADSLSLERSQSAERLGTLRTALEQRLRVAQARRATLEKAADGQRESDLVKRQADLLGAQRNLIQRGLADARITDWESGEKLTVPLDPALSPQENIDALYKRARKLTNAATHARGALPGVRVEIDRLEELVRTLASEPVDDATLERVSAALGIAEPESPTRPVAQQRRLPYREFRIGDHIVLVGRSSRDNDELTRRIARPGDLFLHADQVGGSHVILRRRSGTGEFPADLIVAAGQIAAFFSRARNSGLVPVIYTDVRHVTKPRKAPPGRVRVTNEKSIMVRPLPPPGYHE